MSKSRNDYLAEGIDLTDPDEWGDPVEKEEFPDPYDRCPRCKGTGLDRWEEDDCDECLGEGSIPNLLPNVKRIR